MIEYHEKSTRVETINSRIEGSDAPDLIDESLMKDTGVCPECSGTVIKQYKSVDAWTCYRCKKSFCEDELEKE